MTLPREKTAGLPLNTTGLLIGLAVPKGNFFISVQAGCFPKQKRDGSWEAGFALNGTH